MLSNFKIKKAIFSIANIFLIKKWLIYSVVALITVGMGISLLGEAIIAKIEQRSWFLLGTLALLVINTGLSLLGRAVIERIKASS